MNQQNDWYTGIDYYHNELEKQVTVERLQIREESRSGYHDRVVLYYILSGGAEMEINGSSCRIRRGTLLCLYSHHFYRFKQVTEPVEVVRIQFHIGLFMYMSWEKHPAHANKKLVYDTSPAVHLTGEDRERVEWLALSICKEQEEKRLEGLNMILYMTLQLHAYHCRYAFEAIGREPSPSTGPVWRVIPRVLLATSKTFTIEDAAAGCGCTAAVLNKRVKEACGYTFHQLSVLGKVLNACALLHFPELDVEYISHILEFPSVQSFYRVFTRHCCMTPKEYQEHLYKAPPEQIWACSMGIRLLQYMHLHFYEPLKPEQVCGEFCIKPYTVRELCKNAFGMGFSQMLGQIRVSYAATLLLATDQSVLGISELCGFESVSTFQRLFRQWMCQTPGEYKMMRCDRKE